MYELTIWCWLRIKWFLFRVLKIRFHERSIDKMYQVIEITIRSSHKEKKWLPKKHRKNFVDIMEKCYDFDT